MRVIFWVFQIIVYIEILKLINLIFLIVVSALEKNKAEKRTRKYQVGDRSTVLKRVAKKVVNQR